MPDLHTNVRFQILDRFDFTIVGDYIVARLPFFKLPQRDLFARIETEHRLWKFVIAVHGRHGGDMRMCAGEKDGCRNRRLRPAQG